MSERKGAIAVSEWVNSYRMVRMEAGRQVAQERATRESITRTPESAKEMAKGTDKPAEAKGRKLGLG